MGTWKADTTNTIIGNFNPWGMGLGPCSDGVNLIAIMGKNIQSFEAYKIDPEGGPGGSHKWVDIPNPVIPSANATQDVAIPAPTGYLINGKTYFFVDVDYTEGRIMWWDESTSAWGISSPGPTSAGAWFGMCREPGTNKLWVMVSTVRAWSTHYYDISTDTWTQVDADSRNHITTLDTVASRACFHDGTNFYVSVEDRSVSPFSMDLFKWDGTTWTQSTAPAPSRWVNDDIGVFIPLPDGTQLLIAGYDPRHYIYDPAADTWTAFDHFPMDTDYAEAEGQGACLFDNRVFVTSVQYWDVNSVSRSGGYDEVWVWSGDLAPAPEPTFTGETTTQVIHPAPEALPHRFSETDFPGMGRAQGRKLARMLNANFDATERQLLALDPDTQGNRFGR